MVLTRPIGARAAARIAALLALGLPVLAGCQSTVDTTGSTYPSNHRDRHPIVLIDGTRVLDVFVEGGGGISARGRQDVVDYLGEYRQLGSGTILMQIPVGPGSNPNTPQAVALIRRAVGGRLVEQTYRPTDPTVASPVRLTFRRLQAKVGSKCGLWPDDVGVSDAKLSWRNEQYWNFGCAHQSNFASQIADPNDLVRGRRETPPDTQRRLNNFGQLRQAQDPSTTWKELQVNSQLGSP